VESWEDCGLKHFPDKILPHTPTAWASGIEINNRAIKKPANITLAGN